MKKELLETNTSLNLRDILVHGRKLSFDARTKFFSAWLENLKNENLDGLHLRIVTSPMDRVVRVRDHSGFEQEMVMFGSNSYLGLGVHPYVKKRVVKAIDEYGVGVGGPPLLNGYTKLHRELELRLAAYEGTEDTVLYGSGYSANVGLMSCIPTKTDAIIYDADSHASFTDGVDLGGYATTSFRHNDVADLEAHLAAVQNIEGDRFVGVEGVYSMNGDVVPLDEVVRLCKKYRAILVLDDAHGTGITGPGGSGTAQKFGVHGDVEITLGTFSKAFGVSGGFVSCSKAVADYLRMFSRAYIFSASLSPVVVAAVLAGLDLLESEPQIHAQLKRNIQYLANGLRNIGFPATEDSAILPLPVPLAMNIRAAAHAFHRRGIFINHLEYPAVPPARQRFRISVMATHTTEDLDRLLTAVEEVWAEFSTASGDGLASQIPTPHVAKAE